MKPFLPTVTLCAIDCTDRVHLAQRALEKSMEQCDFGAVKLLTDTQLTWVNKGDWKRQYSVKIPKISTIEEYSRFCVRDLARYVDTKHVLIVQADGYVINGSAWRDEFLRYDYIGAPWYQFGGRVGNGGFSLRSKRLLEITAQLAPNEFPHPEDTWICSHQRAGLEALGMKWPNLTLAARFAFEARAYDGVHWSGNGQAYNSSFGFHSWLSPLPAEIDAPLVFHHSGDYGDVIYSLAVVKALGGGPMFLSPDCKHPYPKKPKCTGLDVMEFYNQLAPLLKKQSYVWSVHPTAHTPPSVDVNFDEFRLAYKRGGAENWESLLGLHAKAFGVQLDGSQPWLEVDAPSPVRPIVVNKTQRYLNPKFPWFELIRKYGHLMTFVGSEQEYQLFTGYAPDIHIGHYPTQNLLGVARAIAGAKVFIGNQSAPLAIAHGLGQRCIVEEWPQNPNCHINRPDCIYFRHGNQALDIPKEWLE